jgi:hypothetical protein
MFSFGCATDVSHISLSPISEIISCEAKNSYILIKDSVSALAKSMQENGYISTPFESLKSFEPNKIHIFNPKECLPSYTSQEVISSIKSTITNINFKSKN